MIADAIRRIRGTARLRKYLDRVEIAVDDTGILKFRSVDAGDIQAVDTLHTQTVAGAKTFTGALTFSGLTDGLRRSATSVTSSATITVTAAQTGTTFISTAGSGTQVFTLPAAATSGLTYSFVCGNAATEIILGVASGDNIVGKTDGATDGTGLVSTVTTGQLKNTAAGNVKGDFVTIVSDGITTWYMVAIAGGWTVT